MQKIAISSVQERNRADPGHTTETGIIHSRDSNLWLIMMTHSFDTISLKFLVTGVIWNMELEFIQFTALPVN